MITWTRLNSYYVNGESAAPSVILDVLFSIVFLSVMSVHAAHYQKKALSKKSRKK